MEDVVKYSTGYSAIPYIKYVIKHVRVKRKWWFGYKMQYTVHSDMLDAGPFNSYEKAINFIYCGIDD